jgi:hypothetical protein
LSNRFAAAKAETERRFKDYQPVYSPLVAKREGRPAKYEPAYCDDVIQRMSQGFSLSAYSNYIQVARKTISEWEASYPEFSLAVAHAKAARLQFWEKLAIEVAQTGGDGSQATMIIFGLKNMGSDEWKERIEHSGTITLAALVESSLKSIEARHSTETIEGQAIEMQPDESSFFE